MLIISIVVGGTLCGRMMLRQSQSSSRGSSEEQPDFTARRLWHCHTEEEDDWISAADREAVVTEKSFVQLSS